MTYTLCGYHNELFDYKNNVKFIDYSDKIKYWFTNAIKILHKITIDISFIHK